MKAAPLVLACLIALAAPGLLLAPSAVDLVKVDEAQAQVIPWSGYWWPMREGGLIDPLCKYDQVTGRRAVPWQIMLQRGDPIEDWFGFCHAWAASALSEEQPTRAVRTAGSAGEEVVLRVGDLKGLLAACHTRDVALVHGRRFREGQSAQDRLDLAPDTLWWLLRLYVKREQLPLILDLDAGPQVWNHPVFAYRVEYTPLNSEGDHLARLIMLFSDSNVEPDFVGVQAFRQVYWFRFRMRGSQVLVGSGRWVGPSVEDHPDFAWYPLVAGRDNPEVSPALVKEILRSPPVPGAAPEPEVEHAWPANGNGNGNPAQAIYLSPVELAAVVTSQDSSFPVSLRLSGDQFRIGDPIPLQVAGGENGYLYLFTLDPDGRLRLLFPLPGQDPRLTADQPVKHVAVASGPAGRQRILALVTGQPLRLAGLSQRPRAGAEQALEFRWHPTAREQVRRFLQEHLRQPQRPEPLADIHPGQLLGRYGQTSADFWVRP